MEWNEQQVLYVSIYKIAPINKLIKFNFSRPKELEDLMKKGSGCPDVLRGEIWYLLSDAKMDENFVADYEALQTKVHKKYLLK